MKYLVAVQWSLGKYGRSNVITRINWKGKIKENYVEISLKFAKNFDVRHFRENFINFVLRKFRWKPKGLKVVSNFDIKF